MGQSFGGGLYAPSHDGSSGYSGDRSMNCSDGENWTLDVVQSFEETPVGQSGTRHWEGSFQNS